MRRKQPGAAPADDGGEDAEHDIVQRREPPHQAAAVALFGFGGLLRDRGGDRRGRRKQVHHAHVHRCEAHGRRPVGQARLDHRVNTFHRATQKQRRVECQSHV
jgi:hypothetical protein